MGLDTTRYQLTSKVGQALLIDKKQSRKVLIRDQNNLSLYSVGETEYIAV